MAFIRARTPEQILMRKDKIVDSTLMIYDSIGYGGVNFSAIAKQSGLSRPSIYSYFKNTNDILLYALGSDFDELNAYLEQELSKHQELDCEGFTKILHSGFMAHPRMLKMLSLNYTVMENGASYEALVDYKARTIRTFSLIIRFIDRFFPPRSKEQTRDFVFMLFSFMLSVYVLTTQTDKQLKAVSQCDERLEFPECSHLSYEGLKAIVATLEKH